MAKSTWESGHVGYAFIKLSTPTAYFGTITLTVFNAVIFILLYSEGPLEWPNYAFYNCIFFLSKMYLMNCSSVSKKFKRFVSLHTAYWNKKSHQCCTDFCYSYAIKSVNIVQESGTYIRWFLKNMCTRME